MRWAGHVVRIEGKEGATEMQWGDLKEGDHLAAPALD